MNAGLISVAGRLAVLCAACLLAACDPPVKYSNRLGEAVEIANSVRDGAGEVNLTQICAAHELPPDRPISDADISGDDTLTATELLVSIRPPLRPGEAIAFELPGGATIEPVRRHASGRFVTLDLKKDLIAVEVVEAIENNKRVHKIEPNCRYAYPAIPDEARIRPTAVFRVVPISNIAATSLCTPTTATCQGVYGANLPWAPNDTEFQNRNQWGLESIKAFEAWKAGKKYADSVLVAVIDTGVKYEHSDLQPNMWLNPNQSETNNPNDGIDNDNNGCADDVVGCTFDALNNCPVTATTPAGTDCDPRDYYGHGTIVASILGSVGDNGSGLASPAWKVKMIPVRVGNPHYWFTPEDLASAIAYADSVGADVANISLTIRGNNSPVVKAEINAASDVLFVTAAGNFYPWYPAAFDLDNIVSVSGIARHDCVDVDEEPLALAWDKTGVDIGAPGVQICAICGDSYCYDQGSSVAAPFVSSAAALIESAGDYSPIAARKLIIDNRRFSSQLPKSVSHGTLDMSFLADLGPPGWSWICWVILFLLGLVVVATATLIWRRYAQN